MDKKVLINILKQAGFSGRLIDYVNHQVPSDYKKLFKQPFAADYLKNPLINLSQKQRLYEVLTELIRLERDYISKGMPIVHFLNSIYDLSYRLERYAQQHGSYGLSDHDIRWLTPLFRGEIFDLGVLRFKVSRFSYEEIERSGHEYMPLGEMQKRKFPEGTPIITIHILKDTDFRPHKIDASLHTAVNFFEAFFPNHHYEALVCRTWLLYGPLVNLLPENSNIASFFKRFDIIAENKDVIQPLKRIYGTSDLRAIESMDKQSSLAKTAYQNIDKLGTATGVIYKNTL